MTRASAAATSAVVVAAVMLAVAACGSQTPVAPPPTSPSSTVAAPQPGPATAPPAGADPVPAPVEGPVVMAASVPLRLEIPVIGVDTELMELGLLDDGTLEVPPDGFPAGWYDGGPTPGELGPAVLAGHVDWVTGPGVFYDLGSVAVGDEVRVSRSDGTVAAFRVTAVGQYPKDEFPTDLVYGDLDHAGLRLITCGGAWNPATRHYEANTVVFADLVTPRRPEPPTFPEARPEPGAHGAVATRSSSRKVTGELVVEEDR